MIRPAAWIGEVERIEGLAIVRDAAIARETTFRVGGRVACLARPKTASALLEVLETARKLDLPHVLLGGGSNVLMPDQDWDVLVVQVKGAAIDRRTGRRTADAVRIHLAAGVTLASCHRFCLEQGLFGLETLVGIPGTIGGALVMNAGAHGGTISQALVWLELLTRQGERKKVFRDQLSPGYRTMGLPEHSVVLGACFQLRLGPRRELRRRMRTYLARRKNSQPLGWPSAGCVFKNPPNRSAGALIEEAGLKGMRIGDAEISRQHANWIINRGKAKARDVLALIQAVEKQIEAQFGIRLERELVVWEQG